MPTSYCYCYHVLNVVITELINYRLKVQVWISHSCFGLKIKLVLVFFVCDCESFNSQQNHYSTGALRECRHPSRQLITTIWPGFMIWRVSMVIHFTRKKLVNFSSYHCRAILKIASKSAHNLLSNGRISDLGSQYGDPNQHQNLST